MGLFDFLEDRLEEFLRNNPHLQLQALEEQLLEQEEETLKLILDLQKQEKRCQDQILTTAQDIQKWHERVTKAQSSQQKDLIKAAQEKEEALLRQGNQLWGQMQGAKQQIESAKNLYKQIQAKLKEVKAKIAENKNNSSNTQAQWTQSRNTKFNIPDDLEAKFRQLEMEQELEQLKRNTKR